MKTLDGQLAKRSRDTLQRITTKVAETNGLVLKKLEFKRSNSAPDKLILISDFSLDNKRIPEHVFQFLLDFQHQSGILSKTMGAHHKDCAQIAGNTVVEFKKHSKFEDYPFGIIRHEFPRDSNSGFHFHQMNIFEIYNGKSDSSVFYAVDLSANHNHDLGQGNYQILSWASESQEALLSLLAKFNEPGKWEIKFI